MDSDFFYSEASWHDKKKVEEVKEKKALLKEERQSLGRTDYRIFHGFNKLKSCDEGDSPIRITKYCQKAPQSMLCQKSLTNVL